MKTIASRGNGSADVRKQPIGNDAPGGEIKSYGIIPHKAAPQNTIRRLSSKRWRSYVPFIAHYIGQETAVETPGRLARRHSEFARKAYQKQLSSTSSPRIITLV